jgi:tRNA G18 (ribose-2'-O)-methylase SpoU
MNVFVILYNIRSAHNVGSIFRTADGAGVSKIYIVGYTPAPVDRFGRIREDIQKTSLGATDSVPWESVEHIEELIAMLHEKEIAVVAVEQHVDAIMYMHEKPLGDVAYIFGNETGGIPLSVSQLADRIVEIPMYGKKESLNVSVSAGIILFHVCSRSC